MITASCHCGALSLEIDAAPTEITDCNCSIRRRYGVLWAYYPLAQVRSVPPDAPTGSYMWDDRAIAFHRCKTCGCVSHWSPVDRRHDRMGVNARLLPPDILARARVRHLDGADSERYID
jgi:hypothetical protein